MKSLIIILLFISFGVKAESIPLPPSIATIDDIVEGLRNTLSTKIVDLGKNFISAQNDKTIFLKSSTPIKCNGSVIPLGEPASILQYNFKKSDNELIEKAIYSGCQRKISLVEDVVTRGSILEPLKYTDFIRGKRNFDLNDGEDYRLYRISNVDNEEIFKLLIEKKDNSKIAEFYILGQKFLRINYTYQATSTKAAFTYFGFKGTYKQTYSSWEFNTSIDTYTNTVIATNGNVNQITYLDSTFQPFSQNEFLSTFNKRISDGAAARIRDLIDYHTYFFPATVQVLSSSGNDHLKEELRVAFNRLQNNTELPLVKLQIQEYINAAEKGQLIDKRPK